MSALYPVPNPTRGKCVLLIGQSWVDMFREKSGGALLMQLLTTSNYFSGLYGRCVMCGQGGTSTLKRYSPNLTTTVPPNAPVVYGYWWNEDTWQPGPLLTGFVTIAGNPVQITTLAHAMNYWFTLSGFLTPTDVASITDVVFMQGQGDELGLTTNPSDATLWKEAHKAVIEYIRATINPSDPTSIRVHLDGLGRRFSGGGLGTQLIREKKLEICTELVNVCIGSEFYDLNLMRNIDPLGDDHLTDVDTLDAATRLWQSIIAPTTRKLGPVVSGMSMGAANRIDVPITVESGETLVKPASPYGFRVEINGIEVIPDLYAWSGNTLQIYLPVNASGTVTLKPVYGPLPGFLESKCIRYAPSASGHPYFGRLNLPLRFSMPISIVV